MKASDFMRSLITATSGTIEQLPKLQRNSGNAEAIFGGSTMLLIVSQSLNCKRLCFPFGIGFWIISPLIYSLAGFVSGSLRNSSRVMALSVVIDTAFVTCSSSGVFLV